MEENHYGTKRKKAVEGEGRKGTTGNNGSITKHYPWLLAFDNEAKARLTIPDVTNTHVLKLITLLESNISPEVTKLRNKPNRATKFLVQIHKRVSMTKVGGYMIDRESEHELFPTYGLLMTHILNLTLVSSKIEKYGAQRIASELYYFLKLMFEGDKEYVLDVALCSTLDEHATSKHKVGFQLFSFIVEDWRCYSDTHSSLMKYCAISSLLSDASQDGQHFVEKNLPVEMDKDFPKFVSKTLHVDIAEGIKKKKMTNLKTIVNAIKVTSVKSISRSRLVVVSKKDISKNIREDSSDMSETDSLSSTVVNHPTSSNSREKPSSSGNAANEFFNDIGLNFCLDTVGDRDLPEYDEDEMQGDDDNDTELLEYGNLEESVVSSSSNVYTNTNQTTHQVNEGREKEDHIEVSDIEQDNEAENLDRMPDRVRETGQGYEPRSDDEAEFETVTRKRNRRLSDSSEDDFDISPSRKRQIQLKMESGLVNDREEDNDSELEILSEKIADTQSSNNDEDSESDERDEAEAESGEDAIPNYDENTSDEAESDGDEERAEKTTVKNDKEKLIESESLRKGSAAAKELTENSQEDEIMDNAENKTSEVKNEVMEAAHSAEGNCQEEGETDSQLDDTERVQDLQHELSSPPVVPKRKSTRKTRTPRKILSSTGTTDSIRSSRKQLQDEYEDDTDDEKIETGSVIAAQTLKQQPSRRGRKSVKASAVPVKESKVSTISPRITRTRASAAAVSSGTPAKVCRKSPSVTSTSSTSAARDSPVRGRGRGRRGAAAGASVVSTRSSRRQ